MKKKLTCLALALALTLSLSVTAFATEIDQDDGSPATADTVITTSITPTYVVTIPADTDIPFEATSTELGDIELTSAHLEPGYVVTVSASAGALTNDADSAYAIPYTLESEGSAFTSAQYSAAGDYTTLDISIEQTAWDSAPAGSYTGTITFTVNYTMS